MHVTRLTDAGLAAVVKQLPHLRSLRLGAAPDITDKGYAELAKLKRLTSLTVSHSKLTDKGMAHLATLKLRSLKINFTQELNDAAMTHVAKIKTLRHLNLFGAYNVTDKGVAQLAALKNLKTLSLGMTRGITDATIAKLAHLELEKIDLSSFGGCVKAPRTMKITDASLETFATMPTLREVTLSGCASVTGAGVRELRRSLPGLTVIARRSGD